MPITWSGPNVLSSVGGENIALNNAQAGVRDDANTLHVVWRHSNDIRYYNSGAGSTTTLYTGRVSIPTIDMGPGREFMYIAWIEDGNEIKVIKSPDRGNTWTGPKVVYTGSNLESLSLHVHWEPATRRPEAVLTWAEGDHIHAMNEYGSEATLSAAGSNASPSIAAWQANVFVVWEYEDPFGAKQIQYCGSTDAGNTWTVGPHGVTLPTGAAANPEDPTITVTPAGALFIAYHVTGEIYVLRTSGAGSSFTLVGGGRAAEGSFTRIILQIPYGVAVGFTKIAGGAPAEAGLIQLPGGATSWVDESPGSGGYRRQVNVSLSPNNVDIFALEVDPASSSTSLNLEHYEGT